MHVTNCDSIGAAVASAVTVSPWASESECLGSTGGGPDVVQYLELRVKLLHQIVKNKQCEIDQLNELVIV